MATNADSPTLHTTEQLARSFHNATLNAASVMSDWTQGRVIVSLDEVREVPLEMLSETLGLGWDPATMVRVGVAGPAGGELILTLDLHSARRLTNLLVGQQHPTTEDSDEWTELQISAAMETGNIFASAYLNELSRHAGRVLFPTPPEFLQDFAASVIEQAAMTQAAACDRLVVGRVRFELDGDILGCHVVVILSPELLQCITESISRG